MSSIFSNWWGNEVLYQYMVAKPVYLGLHETDPGVLADPGSEVVGNGYVRELFVVTAPSNKTVANSEQIEFEAMPDCVVRYYALWTALAGGYMLVARARSAEIAVASNQKLVIPALDIAITL